jgi:glucan biosynthesis protein
MHATHGWKAYRIYFHTQQTARHFNFPIKNYGQISGDCSGGQQSRKTTSGIHLVVNFHIAYLQKLHFVFTQN